MLKLMHKLNRVYKILNKYIYLLPIITLLSNLSIFKDNKIVIIIRNLLKIFIFITVIITGFVLIYFTDFTTPITSTYSLYYDLLEPYIEIIKSLYNKIINYFNNIYQSTTTTDTGGKSIDVLDIDSLKIEVKAGMKEAIEEAIDKLDADAKAEAEGVAKARLIKLISFYTGSALLFYFCFIIPSNVPADVLTDFNLVNQSLIEVKTIIVNFIANFNKPGNPSNPGNNPLSPTLSVSSAITDNLSTITPNTPTISNPGAGPLSPTISITSSITGVAEGMSTITPNTPNLNNYLNLTGTHNVGSRVNASTQTTLDGITFSSVSKVMEYKGV